MYVIEEALSAIEENNIEQANLLAIPIAKAGVAMLTTQGAKSAQEDWFNPYQKILDIRKAKEYVSEDAARTFLELYKVNAIPNWVMCAITNDEIELIKNAGL